ncbi:MAG: DNA mismatch repair protein MutT, partial [Alphaproteobacteria bacterium]|nr:DNA mismatch repair protein MutT [Alphaproteobacteria bacterium]
MSDSLADPPVRDAASVLVVRRDGPVPSILMGMRGAGAVFMPSKFVFPGGAVDPSDMTAPLARPLAARCRQRLLVEAGATATGIPEAIAAAA